MNKMAKNNSTYGKSLYETKADWNSKSKFLWRHQFVRTATVLAVVLAWISSTFVILTTIEAIRRLYCSLPYGDMWWCVGDMSQFRNHRIGLAFLWQQLSEHRIVLPRLIFWIDLQFFQFRGTFTIICCFLLQIGEAFLLCFAFWRGGKNSLPSKLAYVALVFCMMFSASQIDNFLIPIQILFPLAFFMASLSIFFVLWHCEDNGRHSVLLILGLIAAACSTLSQGCGLIVWPILLIICLSERVPLRTRFATGIAGIIMWTCYFVDYYRPSESANPWTSLTRPVLIVRFAFTFLASGLSSSPLYIARIAAPFILITAIVIVASYLFIRPTILEIVPSLFVYLALFLLATSYITALGRSNYGLEGALAMRYRLPSLIFWACVLGLLFSLWDRSAHYGLRILGAPLVSVLFIAIYLVPVQQATVTYYEDFSNQLKDDSIALAFDVTDAVYDRLFVLRPDLVRTYTPFLRENHLSVFSDPLFTARGRALASIFSGSPRQDCLGAFESMKPLEGSTPRKGMVSGWGWLRAEKRSPDSVVLADENGTIVGLAHGLESRPDLAATFHNSELLSTGWSGYYHAEPSSKIITAYGILPDRKTLCSLGQLEVGQ
jgi:hypothetical protein